MTATSERSPTPATTGPVAEPTTEGATGGAGTTPERPSARFIVAAVLLSLLWPALWVAGQGNADVLLGAGDEGPARAYIEDEIPDLAPLVSVGHDGQQFYVIARDPFDPTAATGVVDEPAYRYRRILFPLLAGTMAPNGGRPLIAAFFALSVLGVVLGAWALRSMGGPRWLPLVVALNPAVVTSLTLSLSDALGSGLGLAAVALATRRRWAWAVGLAVLAALTRETFLIVALSIALAPGMPVRWRLASVAVPGAAVLGWMAYLASQVDSSILANSSNQLALPFTGLFGPHTDSQTWFMTLLAVVLLVAGARLAPRTAPHVRAVLALQAVLLVCVSDLVAFNYANSIRTAAPLLPLAVWAILVRERRPAAARAAAAAPTAPTTA